MDAMPEPLSPLLDLALRHFPAEGGETGISGVRLGRATAPTAPVSGVFEPMACLVLQGSKQVHIGDRLLRYDPSSYFVASVELAAAGWVSEASPDRPYVALSMTIDCADLAGLIEQVPDMPEAPTCGFSVNPVTPELISSMHRLLALLDTPTDIPVLAPMLRREVLYRLLQADRGGMLRQIAQSGSRLSQIQRAIAWMRAHYDAPLRIDALAELAGMSKASFHRHFKAATAMSPLQYRKTLQLQEARRLLFVHGEAQNAAYRVGYESVSQFTREYARMFGVPPGRDAARMRGEGEGLAVAAI